MFSMPMLPDLTPRDPHNLWYTSRHGPSSFPHHLVNPHDPSNLSPNDAHPNNTNSNINNNNNNTNDRGPPHHHGHHGHPSRDRRALLERTPLARLRFEEQLMDRRRLNVSNFGSAWLKPPGVPKTLFQMREERREAEEHAEAMRREQQLAAQLAEAEAERERAMGGRGGNDDLGLDENEDEEDLDAPMGGEGQELDLDDDIPEAEGFGFDGDDDSEDEETIEEEEEDDDDDEGSVTGTGNAGVVQVSPAERRDMREQVRDMRAAEDRMREVMNREREGGGLAVDDDDDDDDGLGIDAEDRADMLEEDDLVHGFDDDGHGLAGQPGPGDISIDMDMDADLDGDVPEADDGYEHTDSDAELSEDGTRDLSFAGTGRGPQASRFRRSLARSSVRGSQRGSLARSEFDISGLLSRDGSSYMESSPRSNVKRRGG